MKIKSSQAGFTLVEIMIVVAIIGLLAAIAIPNYVKARETSQTNACLNNLRQIDSCVQQWALEEGLTNSDPIDSSQVALYLRYGNMSECPAGGSYIFGATVGTVPCVTCPNAAALPSHALQ